MALSVYQICEIFAKCMEHLCNHDWHGYTQAAGTPGRWGDGEGYCIVNVYNKDYKLEQGDRDCSSAVISIIREVLGIPIIAATYTGNMKKAFLDTGLFKWHERDSGYKPRRGIICLNEKDHVALHLGNGLIGEFSIAENGDIYGKTGDQTGYESRIRPYYDYPWDGFLEYTGGNVASEMPPQSQASNVSVVQPRYRVLTEEDGWLEWVRGLICSDRCGDDCAGIRGHLIRNVQVEDLGPHGWFRLTMKKQGLLPKNAENKDLSDYVIGVTIYYDTPDPLSTGYYVAKYRVSPIGQDYLKYEYDDNDGGAGDDANGIDRLQITIEQENSVLNS